MLGNGIKQTTSTGGTGNLTLAAVTGYPKVSDAFPIGLPLSYVLLDSGGLFLEAGIGYLVDSVTLVRAKVCTTFVAGVYNATNPTPVTLAGTTTVDVSPHASTLESMLPTVDKVSASVARYIQSAGRNMNQTTVGLSTLRVYYIPFLLKAASPVISLMLSVGTAAVAGSTARLGIYAMTESGYPGQLLATTGALDVATTGQKVGTLATPLSLPPGWYVLAVVSDGSPTVTAATTGGSNMIGGNPFGYTGTLAIIDMRYESVASAVLPTNANPATTALASNTHNPVVYVGVL
jgi:hypothetical protein